MMPREDSPQWRWNPETGADVWIGARPTVREIATVAGTKPQIAAACGVSERTVGNWRSGDTSKVPFSAVVILARMANVPIGQVQP